MILNKLINLGVTNELEFYQKREIRIVNLFALITLVSLLFGLTNILFVSVKYPSPIVLFTTSTSILVLLFNYYKKYDVATYFFVIPININVFILCHQYDESVGNYLYFFLIIFCVAALHNPTRSNYRTIFFFCIIFISFLSTKLFTFNGLLLPGTSEGDVEVLLFYNQIIAFTLSIVLVYLVVKLINKQTQETLILLDKEKEAQIKISQSLKEKEVLLAELQHRVKNNLAVITGLLNLQTEKAPCNISKDLMIESRNRVMSIAMVHNRLYKHQNLSTIDFKTYVSELVSEIMESFPVRKKQIKVIQELDNLELEITKAVPIGLIINEAITNSLKHAFNQNIENPTITIEMKNINDSTKISLIDNGIGSNVTIGDKDQSLGLSLIESLADQIDANTEFNFKNGTSLVITFKK